MNQRITYIFRFFILLLLTLIVWLSNAHKNYSSFHRNPLYINPPDTPKKEMSPPIDLPYPITPKDEYPYKGPQKESNLYLKQPKNIHTDVDYDPKNNEYDFKDKIGDKSYQPANTMSFKEYQNYDMDRALQTYWRQRSKAQSFDKKGGLIPNLNLPGGELLDKIFGSSTIDIRPQGSAELIFGILHNRRDDPALDVKQRKTTNFDFQEKIQMNVTAKIGDKIQFATNYNTEATFDFENKMKLGYEGKEDEIIKNIEAGDVSMPLSGTLITGTQSLFGIKTKLQFGKLFVTSVFSQQKSQSSSIQVSGGAQLNKFKLRADEYEDNKHFFISQYFRNTYNSSLKNLPIVNSAVNITKIEVWVTNIGPPTTDNRNIAAFMDLGEYNPYNKNYKLYKPIFKATDTLPRNEVNSLYADMNNSFIRNINTMNNYLSGRNMTSGIDYEKVEKARRLTQSEYTFNSKLGFISLNTSLNPSQVLAVAYQYTIFGDTGVYQVGEFSSEGISTEKSLLVKLIKSTAPNTKIPLWKLMMKNVYSLSAFQVNSQDFRLNILYRDNATGVPMAYLREGNAKGVPIIRALGLDRLNTRLDPQPDGIFDFIDNAATQGGTMQSSNGRIFFPMLEPFGKDMRMAIDSANPNSALASKYAYDSLYSMSIVMAQQHPEQNKFTIEGTYKSASGSEISLNAMNIPKNSVTVTAGGIKLQENVDYTVDYMLGRVKIINQGILNSGTPINVSFENNSLFGMQMKTLMGTNLDYRFSKNFHIGGTIMHLKETPLTQKVNFGNEPISNTMWGMNGSYQTESKWLTKMVDKLPFIHTKAPSQISATGEFANLIPGHSKRVGKNGNSYIDDFEGSKATIDLKDYGSWFLSSTPQGQTDLFPEAATGTGIKYGFNRALFNWYVIDPSFLRNNTLTPDHIKSDITQQSNDYVREVLENEVFPYKESQYTQPINIPVLNLSFYPEERGPYNYDVSGSSFSKGLSSTGKLLNPETRWGGMMRSIVSSDFELTNVEYIEFWLMDPFIKNSTTKNGNVTGGELYFNLGEISEDILRDSRQSYENGLPPSTTITNVDTTVWGRVPTITPIVNNFDADPASRPYQDVGLDGLGDADERLFFSQNFQIKGNPSYNYLGMLKNAFGETSDAYKQAYNDPSADDYHYFWGDDYDNAQVSILDRYKKFNGTEGNTPTSEQYSKQNSKGYPTIARNAPDVEDINRDNTLSEEERYFQYKVDLKPEKMNIGQNYISDILETSVSLKNGNSETVKWYQFRIPVHNPDKVVGNIQDFRSIRFMRMFMRNFKEPITCRFATLQLVRSEWRKYDQTLLQNGDYVPTDYSKTDFSISAVNIEENGKRSPIPYVLPPDIQREINVQTTNLAKLNEQSLVMQVCNLVDGDARAIYKTSELDMRQYKKIQMFSHVEDPGTSNKLKDDDLRLFIRLGLDFTQNYYEYEIPLKVTEKKQYSSEESISETDRERIWPPQNNIEIDLSQLVKIKEQRNYLLSNPAAHVSLSQPYDTTLAGGQRITVAGVPNIQSVQVIMIGVRNPKKTYSITSKDDAQPKCAEVWIDELRLTDFVENGGWAALGRVNATLADLGNVSIAGNISTPGFGSIDKKLNERQTSTIKQIDFATNIELGKFFGDKSGVKIPMHYDYSKTVTTPKYDPLDPDVTLTDDIKLITDTSNKSKASSYKKSAEEYTERKNLNFMNVRKERTNMAKKAHLFDISNFDITYAFSEIKSHNINYDFQLQRKHKGALGYNFTTNPEKVQPFKKIKLFSKGNLFALFRDFNFYYTPKMLSFRTDINRDYEEYLLRNNSGYDLPIQYNYLKNFTWTRQYNFKYDLTQALHIDYSANASAQVIEPDGRIEDYSQHDKKIIWDNISSFGDMRQYDQKININYTIPINKFPMLDWVSCNYTYGGEYHWTAPPRSAMNLENNIENGNSHQVNGSFNTATLYNKIRYLKNLNQTKPAAPKAKKTLADKNQKSKNGKSLFNSKKHKKNQKKKKGEEEIKDSVKVDIVKLIIDNTLKVLMGVKNISFTYSETNGLFIPGFNRTPQILGMDLNSNYAPSPGFVFGLQDKGIDSYYSHGYLSNIPEMNGSLQQVVMQPFSTKHSENLSVNATIEPIKDLRIQLMASSTYTLSTESYLASSNGRLDTTTHTQMGTFSMSILSYKTAFVTDDKNGRSKLFQKFKNAALIIAKRLASKNPNYNGQVYTTADSLPYANGFPKGYGPTSQSVLIPAFISAYTGKDPNNVALDIFQNKLSKNFLQKIPYPNWRITYNGLSKISFVKEYFQSITMSHSYSSRYNVGSFSLPVDYGDRGGYEYVRETLGEQNFIPKNEVAAVSITEQFGPLINLDMTWKNNLLSKVEIRRSRNLSLSFANNQLTEVTSNEMIFGLGYRFKDVVLNLNTGGQKSQLKSDLSIKVDVSIRTNKTALRRIIEDDEQYSSGQRVLSINLSADYLVSKQLTIRFFFDNIRTKPFVSNQYYNANTRSGISLRFTLS